MSRSTVKPKASFLASLAALVFLRTLLGAAVVVAFGAITLIGTPPDPWMELLQTLAFGVVSGIFSFFLLWLMFGANNLTYRVVVIGLVELSATAAVLTLWRDFLFSDVDQPVGQMDPAYLFWLYRLGVLTFAVAVGLLLQSVTHLRMRFATFPQTNATRREASSLLRLLIAISFFAASFAALRQVDGVAYLYDLQYAMRSIGILEIAPPLIVVLPPLLIIYALDQQRYAALWHIAWTLIVLIALFSLVHFFPIGAHLSRLEILTLTLGLLAYRLTLAIVLRWMRRYGLEFRSTRQHPVGTEKPSQVTLARQIRGVLAFSLALVPLALLHLGVARYYLPIVFDSGCSDPWSVARGVRLLQRKLHQRPILSENPFPTRQLELSLAWPSPDGDVRVQLEYNDGQIRIVTREPIDPTLLGYVLPKAANVEQLVITPFQSAHRQPIAGLRGLDTLQIGADFIEASDVRWLAEHTRPSFFDLACNTLSQDMANSLRLLCSQTDRVQLFLKTPLPKDARRTLQECTIDRIVCPVDTADSQSLIELAHIPTIRIVNSRISPQQLEALTATTLIRELQFVDCAMGKDCIEPLSRISAMICTLKVKWSDVSDADLLFLAGNTHDTVFQFPGYSPVWKARFDHRAKRYASEVESSLSLETFGVTRNDFSLDDLFVKSRTRDDDWLVADTKSKPLESALSDMAHEIARDDDGQITELELQEMVITAEGARRLEELPRLRRLCIAHPGQDDALFEALGRLISLRQLEIPSHGFSDQSMRHIATLTELRHLQLPLPHYSTFWNPHIIGRDDLILPMQRGMYVDRLRDALDTALASHSMNSGLYESMPTWTAAGVYELEKLHKLEFLYLPGWLLDTNNINTIAGLQNLQTLRAPFSVLPAESIRKLGAMEQLRKLTIGIDPTDAGAKSALSALQGLDELHLLIFSFELSDNVAVSETFEKEVQALLPNCRLQCEYLRWDVSRP